MFKVLYGLSQDPLRCAFAVADTNSYYIFVVNEDEAKPMAMELDLGSLPGIIPGSTAVASLIATGCVCMHTRAYRMPINDFACMIVETV